MVFRGPKSPKKRSFYICVAEQTLNGEMENVIQNAISIYRSFATTMDDDDDENTTTTIGREEREEEQDDEDDAGGGLGREPEELGLTPAARRRDAGVGVPQHRVDHLREAHVGTGRA